jgi:hypothetical protein
MTIVTTRPRKRPAKPAQAAEINVPRMIAAHAATPCVEAAGTRSGGKARAVAFFERMGIKRREGG